MTKTENRAAAKAYHREQEDKRRAAQRALDIAEDLEHLRLLRDYIIFKTKVRIPAEGLINAIDDYVEQLTGDRRALHDQNHSIP